jgi:cytochrome c-type biogenesis protein
VSGDPGQVSFALAFLAGLASFASPCVLPVVPGYVGFVTGATLEDFRSAERNSLRRRAAVHAALFILGFSGLFIALGASATALAGLVRRSLPLIQQVGGAVIVLFGLYLVGVVRLPLLLQEKRIHLATKPAGMIGSVVAGVAFGAGWTPCIGPVLASILLYAGLNSSTLHGAALLGAYALGLGVPFFVAAVALDWFLSRSRSLRPWLVPIERAAGVVLVLAGVLLFTGRFATMSRLFAP